MGHNTEDTVLIVNQVNQQDGFSIGLSNNARHIGKTRWRQRHLRDFRTTAYRVISIGETTAEYLMQQSKMETERSRYGDQRRRLKGGSGVRFHDFHPKF